MLDAFSDNAMIICTKDRLMNVNKFYIEENCTGKFNELKLHPVRLDRTIYHDCFEEIQQTQVLKGFYTFSDILNLVSSNDR